jgi:flagellar hook-length control protein FliK
VVDKTAQKPAVDLTLAISAPTTSAPTDSASTVSTQVADQSAINPNIGPQLAISTLSSATDNPGTLEGAEATSVTPTSISATNQAPQMKLTVDNAEATEQVMAGAAPMPSTVPSRADAKSAETLIPTNPTNPTNITKPTTPATEFLGNNPLFHRDAARLMAIANANQPLKELSSDKEKIDRKSSLEAALNTNSPITVSRLSNDAINAKIAGFAPNIVAFNRPERFSIATTINTDQAPEISPLPSALSPLSSAIDAADKNDLLLRNSSLESTANTSTLTAPASQSTANQVTTIDLSSSTPNHEQSMSDAYFRRSEQYQQIANQMAEAVGQRLSAQIARGAWSMTIQLSPAHLGKIDIQLHMREGKQLEADFTTTNKNARDLILQGMNKLKDSLEESGISMGRMNVGQDARGSNQSNANSGEPQSQQQPTFRATKSNRNNTSADDSTTITPSPRKPDPSIGNLDVMV